ncbi:MAG: exonuclease domain-containing protein [Firmicutes bacterium]|nr:exonuclease domain-containing protein [Bacillota bacterium]
MKKFIEKFHDETQNLYPYLILNAVNVSLRKKQIELVLLYPESVDISISERTAIEQAAKKVLNSNAAVEVKLLKSHFDAEFCQKGLLEFFKAFPCVTAGVTNNDIVIDAQARSIEVFLEPVLYEYCIQRGLAAETADYLKQSYCAPPAFSFKQKEPSQTNQQEQDRPETGLELEMSGGRFIVPKDVRSFIGTAVKEPALYISDALHPNPALTVCGKLADITPLTSRRGEEEKKYYRMTLEDFTGRLECLFFPRAAAAEKISTLEKGSEIVVRGALEPDKRNTGGLVYFIRDISYCTLPENFTLNRYKRKVDAQYRVVAPQPYIETQQASIFEGAKTQRIPSALHHKTVVVFDVETTGISQSTDKIVELAAVKMENGILTESFSTLINPGIPIPDQAAAIHGITDKMVADKPSIQDVLPDFYKFVQNAALAAHNLPFDLAFVSAAGSPMGIYFDNEKLDTLQLARSTFTQFASFRLGALCEALHIPLNNAHRALADASATAKLLIKIAARQENI